MKAYCSDHFELPLPLGHRFPMSKYGLLRRQLQHQLPNVTLLEAPRATDGQLALAHEPDYIHAVTEGSLSVAALREIGFPWSQAMAERSRRSVGATVAAARSALRDGLSASLAGGTHHAYATHGSGFCVFNDVAVAARLMQAEWAAMPLPGSGRFGQGGRPGPLQVAVIDLDVHQGNGTAKIFADDQSVFTLSMHGMKNFPFRKERSDLDVELPDGCADEHYLLALDLALAQLATQFSPGLVFFLAGADPFSGDRLGRLQVSAQGLQERDRRVFDWCRRRAVPMAFVMAGGYGSPIEDTVAIHCNTFRIALEQWPHWENVRKSGAGILGTGKIES